MDSFSSLSEQFTPMIHHVIRSLSIYKNKEDYFQIGLIALWESQGKYDEANGQFSNFAYTVIKGRMINELKRQYKYDTFNQPVDRAILDVRDPFSLDKEAFLGENFMTYTKNLTLNQKRWLILTFIEDKNQNEIANMFNVSTAAVKSWRKTTLHKLRKEMEITL
ncbi:sigma-70 family RNA polymerase sigma factor [Peribacillus sp. NPDC097675]|uniref:sigma-70 family RNA polymerase sigma factor n=1 Tax=Peribacillus sp. NPDC097675 TaxID=3390618 RepID=UPI003D08D151